MNLRLALFVACGIALTTPAMASRGIKADEGFATRFAADGEPENRVNSVKAGAPLYHWIEWKERSLGTVTLRCVVMDAAQNETLLDRTQTLNISQAEGYSACAYPIEEGGIYRFAQYIDAVKVSELSIVVPGGLFSPKRRIQWAGGGMALGMLAVGWVAWRRGRRAAMAPAERIGGDTEILDSIPGSDGSGLGDPIARYERLMALGDRLGALGAGRACLGPLLESHDDEQALRIAKECLAIDPAFRPARGEDVLPLARAARAVGDSSAAVAILRSFNNNFPGHAQIPEVYVFSAQLMAEDLDDKEMARRILERVVQRYPEHDLARDARDYLESLPHPA